MKKISLVIPLYNEEDNVNVIYHQLTNQFSQLSNYVFEIIFVDDGSKDQSLFNLNAIAHLDKKVKIISLSRNFGNQIALSAGLRASTGDAVITMDCDLQHPVTLVPILIKQWEKNFHISMATRINKKENISSKVFFYILHKITNLGIDNNVSDYRILDRKVVDTINTFTEHTRFVRAMLDWTGFSKSYVPFFVERRNSGHSHFSYSKLFNLGLGALTSFSLFPLKVAFLLGNLIFWLSSILLLFMISYRFIDPLMFTPAAYFIVLNAVLSGLVLICLGIVAHYVGNIHTESLNRPLYIIKDKVNFEEKDQFRD
ncbi:glycosyltransferase family 2 protein [Patescibacteria group bacterium]|nr:glycosyltransferase family 2 protein [Patescibacteria group bacterium]